MSTSRPTKKPKTTPSQAKSSPAQGECVKLYDARQVRHGWGLFLNGERIFTQTVYTSREAVERDIDHITMYDNS